MTIIELKIQSSDFNNRDIMGLPDKPSESGISASALKERFDAAVKYIVLPRFNQLLEELVGTTGAGHIGITPVDGVAGYTVQQCLEAIKILLDSKQSIEQSNLEIGKKFDKTEAQQLVRSIVFTETDGKFTITKQDGSVQTIDTALERVALDVRLEDQQFVLTLADGTEQRVDLSAFLTETEVKDSDTITLAIENGVMIARIGSQSIRSEHLSEEVIGYFEGKTTDAIQAAENAAVSETNALQSKMDAEESYGKAKTCQEQACICATNAKESETNAAEAAKVAKESAEKAQGIAGGDFLERSVYDTENRKQDVFEYAANYTDKAVLGVLEEVGEVSSTLEEQKEASEEHKNNQENPHGVTKAQVGLENVDNTSDADKPISTATQTALNQKANSSHTQAASTITAGTFPATGLIAKTGTDYTTARIRNIKASTTDLTAGTSALSNGDIYLVYE